MKFPTLLATAGLTSLASAVGDDAVGADVASAKMSVLMGLKTAHRENQRGLGVFDAGAYASKGPTPCVAGKAGEFACDNVDLKTFLTHADMGSTTREGNDVWVGRPAFRRAREAMFADEESRAGPLQPGASSPP